MKMQTLALFLLVAVAIGGVAWVFLYPLLSGERNAERSAQTGITECFLRGRSSRLLASMRRARMRRRRVSDGRMTA